MPEGQNTPPPSDDGGDKDKRDVAQSLFGLKDFAFGPALQSANATDTPQSPQAVPAHPSPFGQFSQAQPPEVQPNSGPAELERMIPESGPVKFVEEPFSWDDDSEPALAPAGPQVAPPVFAAPDLDSGTLAAIGEGTMVISPAQNPAAQIPATGDLPRAGEGTMVIPPGQLPPDTSMAKYDLDVSNNATMVMQPAQVSSTDVSDLGIIGSTTSIADSRVAKFAVESGLATPSQVKICMDAVAATAEGMDKPSLADVLVQQGVISDAQAHSLMEVSKDGSEANLLGGYQIISKIGEGGMGAVYKARQINLDRIVALKILPERFAANAEFLNRFLREAKAGGKLDHPHIVRAIDAGKAAGKYYFAMEFVEGQSVEDMIHTRGKLPEEEALSIAIQAARGLECAWRNGLVHRDIKPDNILVTNDGMAKLADLGLAKANQTPGESRLTQDGAAMGTPHYISPEQARGTDVDIRSDIYSLGITLYRMLTGKFPFDGKDPVSIIMARFSERAKPVNEIDSAVSDEVAQAIETMMALDREVRYPDPAVLLHDLELLAKGDNPEYASANQTARQRAIDAAHARSAHSSFLGPIFVKRKRRFERAMIGVGAMVFALAAVAAVFLIRPDPPQQVVVVERGGNDPAKPSAEEEALKALEIQAAEFLEGLRTDYEKKRFADVVQVVDEHEAEYASTSKAIEINALRTQAATRLEEAERRAKQEAEREKRYTELMDMAKEQMGVKDFIRATDLLIQAKSVKDTEEVSALLSEAKYRQYITKADEIADTGKLQAAIELYERALAMKKSDEILSRVKELKRRIDFGAKLAAGDEFAEKQNWRPALGAFEECLNLANEKEAEGIEPRIAKVKAEIAYDDALTGALAALDAKDPHEAMRHAEAAAAMKPGKARPQELILAARKAIGPDKAVTDSLKIDLILMPAGEFQMGSADGEKDEQPPRTVYLDAYYISKYEITNAQFEKFDATNRRTEYSPDDNMPVIAVSWDDASAFCRWLTKEEDIEYRLPTEAEWERAARGSHTAAFPWGDDPVASDGGWQANVAVGDERDSWAKDGFKHAAPVGSFETGASSCGAMDMSGNVWEWCLDWYSKSYYSKGENENPTGPADGKWRVYRGGSFANPASSARCANRAAQKPSFVEASIGFRVVRALDSIFREESPKE